MSLYNALFGHSPAVFILPHALGIDPAHIERYRDAEFVREEDQILTRLLCRTGGGNRADYPNKTLTSHPAYLRDEDDPFDNTYAYYYFKTPPVVLESIAASGIPIEQLVTRATMKERFDGFLDALRQGVGQAK